MQRAAMTIAAHCVGTCTALRFSGQRFSSVRRADPTVQLAPGHRPYNPAHASCISCFIGAKNTTDVSAHSSPLSKESSPNRRQAPVLCPKKTPQITNKWRPFAQRRLPGVPPSLIPFVHRSSTNSLHVPLHCPKQFSCPSKRSHWKQEKPVACPILDGFATGLLLSSSTPPDGIHLQKQQAGRVKEFTWYRSALTVN